MNSHKVFDEEIDKRMLAQRRAISMRKLFQTLHRLSFVKIKNLRYDRFDNDELFCAMGCPDAEYMLLIEFEGGDENNSYTELF